MDNKNIFSPNIILIIIIYILSNCTELINNGVYWDDWTLYNTSFEAIENQFTGNGFVQLTYLHSFLQNLPYPGLVYGWLTIILQIATFVLLWKIINFFWKKLYANWFTAIYSVVPIFAAKNTMICFPYTLHLFIFIAGTYFLTMYLREKKMMWRILSLLFYFTSFSVQSLIVLYIVPIIGIFIYTFPPNENSYKEIKFYLKPKFIFNHLDFFILPFIFILFKGIFMPVTGLYATTNYNKISLNNIIDLPYNLFLTFKYSFYYVLFDVYYAIKSSLIAIVLITTIGAIVAISTKKIKANRKIEKSLSWYIILGIVLFIVGALPYVLVGKIPSYRNYDSRHQLLLGFGISLILISLIFSIVKSKWATLALTLLYGGFAITTFTHNIAYLKSWLKQESIASHFKQVNLLNTNFILFNDETSHLDATSRDLSFYNLTGLYKLATNKQDKIISEAEEAKNHDFKLFVPKAITYNLKDFDFSSDYEVSAITCKEGSIKLSSKNMFKFVIDYYFNQNQFNQNITKVVEITNINQ